MNTEENFASSDSESDEDFCPEKAGAAAEAVSEVDTDDEGLEEEEERQVRPAAKKGRKKTLTKKRTNKQKDGDEDDEEDQNEDVPRRSTRQTEDLSNGHGKATHEKDELLESDDAEKSRTDALWADFMSDVKPAGSKKPTTPSDKVETETPTKKPDARVAKDEPQRQKAVAEVTEEAPKQITITEIVEFAGEELLVQKTVSADSIKENKVAAKAAELPRSIGGTRPLPVSLKRPTAGGSGLGSILDQIGKKKKLSVLEKTQHDWKSFKHDEGIEEQLQTFNKGKDGYLERQDFLQRTDLRQFEIEKNLRQTRRNP